MTSIKKNIVLSIIILIMLFGILFIPTTSYSADAFDSSSFMDLESSIKELKLKVEKAQRSIVMIIAYDDAGIERAKGSGLFIDSEGRIITNALILKGAYSAEVFSESKHYEEVVLLNRREDIDIALVQVKVTNEMPLELGLQSEVKEGERVIVVGKSSSLSTTVSEGLISTVNNIGEISNLIEIETTTGLLSNRPSKDGFVINMDGQVIGITTTVISNARDSIPRVYYGEKFNAISLPAIKPLVTKLDNIEYLHSPRTRVWSRWLKKKLETTAISVFVTLFNIGFTKIVATIFAFILFILLIQELYTKLKKIKSGK
jgi:S1-C subfamily serine protease